MGTPRRNLDIIYTGSSEGRTFFDVMSRDKAVLVRFMCKEQVLVFPTAKRLLHLKILPLPDYLVRCSISPAHLRDLSPGIVKLRKNGDRIEWIEQESTRFTLPIEEGSSLMEGELELCVDKRNLKICYNLMQICQGGGTMILIPEQPVRIRMEWQDVASIEFCVAPMVME